MIAREGGKFTSGGTIYFVTGPSGFSKITQILFSSVRKSLSGWQLCDVQYDSKENFQTLPLGWERETNSHMLHLTPHLRSSFLHSRPKTSGQVSGLQLENTFYLLHRLSCPSLCFTSANGSMFTSPFRTAMRLYSGWRFNFTGSSSATAQFVSEN